MKWSAYRRVRLSGRFRATPHPSIRVSLRSTLLRMLVLNPPHNSKVPGHDLKLAGEIVGFRFEGTFF